MRERCLIGAFLKIGVRQTLSKIKAVGGEIARGKLCNPVQIPETRETETEREREREREREQ